MLLGKKIFSLLLIVLVVGYSGGINIAKHLCEGEVVARALNHEVKICKKAQISTPFTDDISYSKKSCCETEIDFFQSDTFSKISIAFEVINAEFVAVKSVPLQVALNGQSVQNYSTPLLHSPPIYEFVEQYLI